MEFEKRPCIVYVKTNLEGYITAVNSSAFLSELTDWVEIDRGFGDKYHHAQGNYFPKSILTENGASRYKMVDGEVAVCTGEEIANQEEKHHFAAKSLEERVNILESYTAEIKKMLAAILKETAKG